MLFLNTAIDGLRFGLCFSVLAIALYISYTILDFPDLSVDGIFPFGAILGTIAMYNLGLNPILAILLSFIGGMVAGFITGILHVKFNISKLLCGIIVMTAFISITLALTCLLSKSGLPITLFPYKSNGVVGLFNAKYMQGMTSIQKNLISIAILLAIVVVIKILVDLFFKTKAGYLLKVTGENEQMITALGKSVGFYKVLGLVIADGLVGIAGALYAQLMCNYDNACGTGKVVIALISVIMGITIFGKMRFMKKTTACILGALIYSLALYFFTIIDKNGIYLKLFNAVFFALVLVVSNKYKDFRKVGLLAVKNKGKGEKNNA